MDFKISRSLKQCSVCQRKFANREKYYAGLVPRPKEEGVFDRADVCLTCWERQGAGSFTAYWLAEFSTEKKPVLMDPDSLWQVFHNARNEPRASAGGQKLSESELQRFAYVAALGLLRLKQLKLKATKRTKTGEVLVFETPPKVKEKQSYEVLNPALDEKGVEEIQDRLSELA